jgi:two-component system chemotaxis sensor kinase CheA
MIARSKTVLSRFAFVVDIGRDLASCTTLEDLTDTLTQGLTQLFSRPIHWCTSQADAPADTPNDLWAESVHQHRDWWRWSITGPDGSTANLVLQHATLSEEERGVIESFADQAASLWSTFDNFHMLESLVANEMAATVGREEKIQMILDSMRDVLIVCDLAGALTEVRSDKAAAWFGAADVGQPIWETLFPYDPRRAALFEMGWLQLNEGWMPFDVCIDQLPSRMQTSEGRTLSLHYSPVRIKGESMAGVVVTAGDITALVQSERAEQEGRELVAIVQHMAKDAVACRAALSDLRHMVNDLEQATLPVAQRILHTLKGNCASLGLLRMAEVCHYQEDRLAEDTAFLPSVIREITGAWSTAEALVTPLMPSDDALNVSEGALDEVLSLMHTRQFDLAKRLMKTWRYPAIDVTFGQFTDGLNTRIASYGKSVKLCIVTNELHIPYQGAQGFFRSLAHVVRNAWFHGIETEEERRKTGKPASGVLSLSAEAVSGALQIDIFDDGAGIDWDAVSAKAQTMGLPHATHRERVAAVMAPGLTTRDIVNDIAGRGVGLDATRTAVHDIGGTVDITSDRGVGTRWTFRIPLTQT